jgi:hypothetical protein
MRKAGQKILESIEFQTVYQQKQQMNADDLLDKKSEAVRQAKIRYVTDQYLTRVAKLSEQFQALQTELIDKQEKKIQLEISRRQKGMPSSLT